LEPTAGLFEKPYDAKNLLIGSAERWDALLVPKGSRGKLALGSDAYARAEDDRKAATA